MSQPRVLIIGATGFVGSRLHAELAAHGLPVVGGTRHEAAARAHAQARQRDLRFRHVDLDDPPSIASALSDIDVAVYLAHGMAGGRGYEVTEEREARAFLRAAERAELGRIVYLGGIRPRGAVSRHLASRLRTGEILRGGTVSTVELQATMILGSGGESFRLVRDLAARLPWMVLPRWLESRSEPVAIDDVIAALEHALTMPLETGRVFSLPGPEQLSGREILVRMARMMGQDPMTMTVPVLTPRLSTYWIRLVTRAHPTVARELVEGLRSSILADRPTLWSQMPGFTRTPFDEAVRRALAEEATTLSARARFVEHWAHRVAREGQPIPT